ncbi:hypothetical protein [Streptomyces aidingensis]|uniref:Uncharacterized protein n=1 Tax=Streptomyces aidingensis TaxID=910347 RepID=A0A1I1TR53_9ACTN|nr:hypothetical protein [Streptomyces aidingensis]SFD58943.1 hypothetical protein SAMN05421773_12016 [Streptomyces aidingensis]
MILRDLTAVILLTGDPDLVKDAWPRFTAALGTRLDVSMTTYDHSARVLADGGCRVLRVEMERTRCRVRFSEAAPGGGWADSTGRTCPAADAVTTALHLIDGP